MFPPVLFESQPSSASFRAKLAVDISQFTDTVHQNRSAQDAFSWIAVVVPWVGGQPPLPAAPELAPARYRNTFCLGDPSLGTCTLR